MSKTTELPDELYQNLEKVARERGLTPADWIAASLPSGSGSIEGRPLSELLQGLIAARSTVQRSRGVDMRARLSVS